VQLKPKLADRSRPHKNRGRLALIVLDRGDLRPCVAVWLANSCEGS
jgi:hypothetical protein